MKRYKQFAAACVMLTALGMLAGCATNQKSSGPHDSSALTRNSPNTTSNSISGITNTTPSLSNPMTVKLPSSANYFDLKIRYTEKTDVKRTSSPTVQQWDFPVPRHSLSGVRKHGRYRPQKVANNTLVYRGLSSPSAENERTAWDTPLGHIMVIRVAKEDEYEMIFLGPIHVEKMQIKSVANHRSARLIPQKNPDFRIWIIRSNTWYSLTEQGIGSSQVFTYPDFKLTP